MRRPTHLAAQWDAYVRRPFPVLVRLSMNRIFHGSNASEEDLNISMGLLLAWLAVPGGFVSIFLFDKYGSFLQWLRGQANFVAITILTCVCVIDVNAASSILFPVSVGASQPGFSFVMRFAGVHALVVMLASIFSFLAVFATTGVLLLLL